MPDRLAQLRRQRALAQEQLVWIEREITAAEAGRDAKPVEISAPPPATPAAAAAANPTPADEETIIARYRIGSDTLKSDVRKGCFIYFAVALVLLAAGVAILYFILRSR